MNPLLLLGLLGAGAVLLAKPKQPKPGPSRAPGATGVYAAMTEDAKLVTPLGWILEPPITTLDLVRIAAAGVQTVPTPYYPGNVELLNAAVAAFNTGSSTERDVRYAAYHALWKASVVGLNANDRRILGPLDVVAHLKKAKRGDFFPEIHITGGAKKGKYKMWEYEDRDKDEYIAEYWPLFLGGAKASGYRTAVPGPSGSHFIAALSVALVADPALTLFPTVRVRSLQLLKSFAEALSIPRCDGTYDGHDYRDIIENNAGRKGCGEFIRWGKRKFRDALKGWKNGRGLGPQFPEAAMLALADEIPVVVDQVFNAAAFSAIGSEADQLVLIELLQEALDQVLVQKFLLWPGGPAPSPYVDWGWVALWFIKGIGLAAVPGVGLIGLYALAGEAEETKEEWMKGEPEAGPEVTAEQLAAAAYGLYQTAAQ